MRNVKLAEVASINPRGDSPPLDATVSFVGMAELDAEAARATPREIRTYAEVSKGYTVFRDSDILAAKITPCWENGKVGQARLDSSIGVGSTEFHVIRPGEQVHDRYLLHFLRQPEVRETGELRMTGSAGQRRVPVAFLKNLLLPLPDLEEQRRVAAILDQADALRAKRRQVLTQLDTLEQSIFHSMFHQAGTSDATVGDVAIIQGGLQVTSKRAALPIEVPYLRVANAHRGRLDLTEVKTMRATEAEISRTLLEPGDLLFVEGHANPAEIGRVAIWGGELPTCVHQNHLIRARLDSSRVLPIFAATWLNSAEGAAHFRRSGKTTSGLNTISTRTVRTATLPLPSMEEQKLFAARMAAVEGMKRRVLRSSIADNQLFESLQSRAFRGEL